MVDSTAVVDALTAVDGSEPVRRELEGEDLHAPALLDFEIVAALRGLTIGSHISFARANDALNDFDDLAIERWPFSHALRKRAFELRENVSAYDAAYVVLAEALGCSLLTRDARLARSTGHSASILVR